MNKRAEIEADDAEVIVDEIEDVNLDDGVEDEEELRETDGDEEDETQAEEVEEPEEDFLDVRIGDEDPDEDAPDTAGAPAWVKELRQKHREEKRKVRELEEKLRAKDGGEKVTALPPKPTLAAADFNPEKYETALADWYEKKREHDLVEAEKQQKQQQAEQEWTAKLQGYQEAKKAIRVVDYDDAEEVVQETLSVTQQGMILQGADNPALLVYALGRNPKKAKELAGIDDPVKFAFAVARLETQLKVSNKKPSTGPEKVITGGNGRPSGSVDNQLERLRAEAEKTGDLSKVIAYKKARKK